MRPKGAVLRLLIPTLLLLDLCLGCSAPPPPPTAEPTSPPAAQSVATAAGEATRQPAAPSASAPTASATAPRSLPPTAASTVTATPAQAQSERPPSSAGLLDQAVEKGTLDREAALVYKVFAAFGDERLPSAYRGDDSLRGSADALEEAAQSFDRLSPKAQEQLAPFLLPPSAPGSWLQLGQGMASAGSGATTHQVSWGAAAPAVEWGTVITANDRVKVWYQKRYPGDDLKAQGVARAIDATIWNKLANLMGRTPLPDGGFANNGGDSRVDIYLVHIVEHGVATSYKDLPSPAHILLNSSRPLGDETHPGMIQTATHELMHAFEYTFVHKEGRAEYKWLREATSKWAESYVYPKANSEHPYAPQFLNSSRQPLTSVAGNRYYGAYLALYYLWKDEGPEVIRKTWENVEQMDSLAALDKALPDYTADTWWAYFAAANWNQGAEAWHDEHDGLKAGARPDNSTPVSLAGKPDASYELGAGLLYMSAAYYHFTFPDNSVSTVTFHNGLTYALSQRQDFFDRAEYQDGFGYNFEQVPPDKKRERVAVQLLYKIEGQDWQHEDLTYKKTISFCRDARAERLEELVIIYSYGQLGDRSARSDLNVPDLAPVLRVTNIGCWRWQGTVSLTVPRPQGVQETAHTNVVLERDGDGYHSMLGFRAHSGNTTWQLSGTDAGRYHCNYHGSDSQSLSGDRSGTSMVIVLGALQGPLYRAFDGQGTYFPTKYRMECDRDGPKGGTFAYSITPWDFRADEAGPFEYSYLSTDGKTIKGSVDAGGAYEWHLTALRE
ncbi:MAG: hypothetical protein ACYC4L_19010 [Chloroflexota bacterium]